MKSKDYNSYIGSKYNMLTIVGICDHVKGTHRKCKCMCECGNVITADICNVVSGNTKSCGCLRSIRSAEHGFKPVHWETKTRLHTIWDGMRRRCYEKSNKDYCRYGERGIRVCDDWMDYTKFSSWAKANGYADGLTIDRIDTNGDYCPDNCRWATVMEQNNNRRSNHIVIYNGQQHTIAEWSRITGIPPKTLRYRIVSNWDLEDVFHAPIDRTNRLARPT